MNFVKPVLLIVGLLMVAMGVLWVLQGLNIVRWPADSFMLGVPVWSWRGLALAAIGALLVWVSRRT